MSKAERLPAAGSAAKEGPLSGVKVLDFGHMVMGPSCGLVLADLGADVVRVEPPGGDPTRALKGFGLGFFTYFNRNKSSVMFDFKRGGKSQDLARRCLEWADVLIENFAPGVMAKLGLDYATASKVNPRLIYCSLKGFLPGPYEDRLALDEVAQMAAGIAYMTGPKGRPLRVGGSMVDISGGVFGAVGILAALRERDRTGRGQLIESGLFETAAFFTGQHMAFTAISGDIPRPMPERAHLFSVYDLFQARDAEVFVAATSQQQWERFCAEFGFADLAADPALQTMDDRLKDRPRMIAVIAARFAQMDSDDIVERCVRARLPATRVNRPDQLMQDPHLQAGGQLLDITLPDGRTAPLPSFPYRMNGRPNPVRLQPQPAGVRTQDFLHELGYGPAEIEQLAAERVCVAAQAKNAA